MNWRKAMFRVWLTASIAWSAFYLAIALFNYVNGGRGNYWWITLYAFAPVLLGLVVWALACFARRGGDKAPRAPNARQGRWGLAGGIRFDRREVLMASEVLK